jgi:hypothetical protein
MHMLLHEAAETVQGARALWSKQMQVPTATSAVVLIGGLVTSSDFEVASSIHGHSCRPP